MINARDILRALSLYLVMASFCFSSLTLSQQQHTKKDPPPKEETGTNDPSAENNLTPEQSAYAQALGLDPNDMDEAKRDELNEKIESTKDTLSKLKENGGKLEDTSEALFGLINSGLELEEALKEGGLASETLGAGSEELASLRTAAEVFNKAKEMGGWDKYADELDKQIKESEGPARDEAIKKRTALTSLVNKAMGMKKKTQTGDLAGDDLAMPAGGELPKRRSSSTKAVTPSPSAAGPTAGSSAKVDPEKFNFRELIREQDEAGKPGAVTGFVDGEGNAQRVLNQEELQYTRATRKTADGGTAEVYRSGNPTEGGTTYVTLPDGTVEVWSYKGNVTGFNAAPETFVGKISAEEFKSLQPKATSGASASAPERVPQSATAPEGVPQVGSNGSGGYSYSLSEGINFGSTETSLGWNDPVGNNFSSDSLLNPSGAPIGSNSPSILSGDWNAGSANSFDPSSGIDDLLGTGNSEEAAGGGESSNAGLSIDNVGSIDLGTGGNGSQLSSSTISSIQRIDQPTISLTTPVDFGYSDLDNFFNQSSLLEFGPKSPDLSPLVPTTSIPPYISGQDYLGR